jgi:hypothetical protein
MTKTGSQCPPNAPLMEQPKTQKRSMHRPGRVPPPGGSSSLEWAALQATYRIPSTAQRPKKDATHESSCSLGRRPRPRHRPSEPFRRTSPHWRQSERWSPPRTSSRRDPTRSKTAGPRSARRQHDRAPETTCADWTGVSGVEPTKQEPILIALRLLPTPSLGSLLWLDV